MSEVGAGPEAEKVNPNVVEVSGPVRLEEGNNFYDQPPFDMLIGDVAKNVKISVDDFRFFFSRLCVKELRVPKVNPITFTPELALDTPIEELGALLRRHDNKYPTELIGASMKYFIQQLRRIGYPADEAIEYVSAKFSRGLYGADGKYSPHPSINKPEAILPPSFLTWLEEKQAREGRLTRGGMIQVLGDVFSQQLGGTTVTEAVAASGGNVNRRSWRLAVPTGLVHPRPPQTR